MDKTPTEETIEEIIAKYEEISIIWRLKGYYYANTNQSDTQQRYESEGICDDRLV